MRSHHQSRGRVWSEHHAEALQTRPEERQGEHHRRVRKNQHSQSSRNIAGEPVQTSAEPQDTHTPNGNHHQSAIRYRIVKGPDGKRLMVRKASIQDAERHNIPTNYCLDNWDPTERPLILLGSVFDAMSLGKWMVDWTIEAYGEDSDSIPMVGDLWTLLIQLASKVKQSEDFVSHHSRKQNSRRREKGIDTVYGFAQAGKQLIRDLQQLLKDCEGRILETWGLHTSQSGGFLGSEFVRVFFSQEGCLGKTTGLMQSLRLWIADWNNRCSKAMMSL